MKSIKSIFVAFIMVFVLSLPAFSWDVKTPDDLLIRMNSVGYNLLNSSRLERSLIFSVKKKMTRDIMADVSYINRMVVVNPDIIPYIDNDDELAAVLAHEIAHGMDSYRGGLRGYVSILNYWVSPNKYDLKADKSAVDYLVNAGYNPLAVITIMKKTGKQYRYDVYSNHTLISRRMMLVYEYIYTKYPSFLVDNPYKDNIYYQNFLLVSRKNRLKLLDKIENNKKGKIRYSY